MRRRPAALTEKKVWLRFLAHALEKQVAESRELCSLLFAYVVLVRVCTSGKLLVQLLLFEAATVGRHHSLSVHSFSLSPVSTSLRQPMAS